MTKQPIDIKHLRKTRDLMWLYGLLGTVLYLFFTTLIDCWNIENNTFDIMCGVENIDNSKLISCAIFYALYTPGMIYYINRKIKRFSND